MKSKKKIIITQRIEKFKRYNEYRDTLDQRLINWIVFCGFIPIPIPNTLAISGTTKDYNCLIKWLKQIDPDAIIFSGGNNIGDVNTKSRDITEKNLLLWAEKYKKPALGICRGMQMMGVHAGTKLKKISGHAGVRHNLKLNDELKNSIPLMVNSYHDFALAKCPNMYEVLAMSEDNCIEAIKHKKLSWEGWMWHPEREKNYSDIDKTRLIKIVNNDK